MKHKGCYLAAAVHEAAKQMEMDYEDILICCAVLIRDTSEKTGESVEFLLEVVKHRIEKP